MDIIALIAGLAAGGALIWFGKDRIQKFVLGAQALSVKLEAKAEALADEVSKLKNLGM